LSGNTTVSSRFWPASFQERGVSVPFTTPSIAFSRVRGDGRDGLEVLVPGLSGSQGVYVIPWRGLRDMFKMTVHDRALHEEIDGLEAATPRKIREVVLNVSASGLAGPKAKEAARVAQQKDEDDKLRSGFYLIAAVVKTLSGSALEVTLNEVATEEGQREVRNILNRIADHLKMPTSTLHDRMDAWAAAVSNVGVKDMPTKCRVRRSMDQIHTFSDTVGIWGDQTFTGNKEYGRVINSIAFETLSVINTYLSTLDKFTDMAGETLTNWPKAGDNVTGLAEKAEWLLDGWDSLVALWDSSVDEPAHILDTVVGDLFRLLPLAPRDELDSRRHERWAEFEKSINMAQKNAERKGSSTIDLDAMLRLEKTKYRAL
jgi:hypothetical protein